LKDSYFREQYGIAQTSKDAFLVKTAVAAFSAVLSAVLAATGIPPLINGIVGIVLSVAVFIFCAREMADGLVSVFRMHPSNDSFSSVALIAAAVHSFTLLFSSQTGAPRIFTPVIFASVAISMLMKYLFICEIISNLNLIRANKTYVVNTGNIDLRKRLVDRICVVNPVVHFPNVVETTYSGDPSEEKIRLFVPAVCVAVFLVSVVIGIVSGFGAFAASFAALFAIASSFTSEMAFVFPYIAEQRRLRKLGSVLLGYHSIDAMRDVSTLVVSDKDLFPGKYTKMERFRFRDVERMADAVEFTAALLLAADTPFASTFASSTGCDISRLPEVDDWRYMKNYGILGHIYGDEVLIGNRNMLLSYEILPLPQETEASLTSTNRSILYTAINGVLVSYTVFSYAPDPEMKRAAETVGEDFAIIALTNDCNITETAVQKLYGLHNTKILIPDANEREIIDEASKTADEAEALPDMITTKNAIGILSSVRKAKKLASAVNMSVLIKTASIILGLLLTTVAFFINPALPGTLWVFLFNLIWTLPVIFITFVKK
jgi:cation transport ATPase